ncbi:MAG: DUF4435 domain-containing protein [Bryobacterales bacterium]|nr:DUF4435 domain-containing protein [Bryobacterales bacterium]
MSDFPTRTCGDVVAEIAMSRTAFRGALMLVEGSDDWKFWKPRIGGETCQLVTAGSKPTVIKAIAEAGIQYRGLLGVVDDDFDALLNTPRAENIIRTDTSDLETLLLRSEALDRLLIERGDEAKIIEIERREGRPIRDCLIDRSRIFGELRYLSIQHQWAVDFKRLNPNRFIPAATWSLNDEELLREIAARIPGQSFESLKTALKLIPPCDPWVLLHGKDTLTVLQIGLRKVIGKKEYSLEAISEGLRLAFDQIMFEACRTHADIREWERINPPFRVLRGRA